MSTKLTVALIQTNSKNEFAPNIAFIEEQARKAREAGAEFIMTPENSTMLGADRADTLSKVVDEAAHPGLASAKGLAKELGAWFLIGSLHIKVEGGERCANRSYLIDPRGEVVASYDKIHMFDADLPGGERYRESEVFRPGDRPVVAKTPWGVLGMTICYDLRFPHLYRALANAGATLLSVPASFTVPTGMAHWHVLLRARAIETGCFVFAPAQVGTHAGNRKTFGHSLVVAPWGEVLADAGDAGPGFVTAEVDLSKVTAARGALPTLQHDRPLGPVRTEGI
ncbi:MAG TPA: carbon-nitrogen hydrolase family protein [Myxococcales bacterium]|nr:carbon-nitrogen hydrolase family protein [Myxococcales bacterium]